MKIDLDSESMMRKNTARLEISADCADSPAARQALAQAAEALRAGGTVAFPTETVYGLGANALDARAVEGIFYAKGRPAWDPLIVHISDFAMLAQVVAEIPDRARKLMDAFWPGPLTLLLPKTDAIPSIVTAGRALVGVRMPAHPVARALIAAAGVPLAAPSANRFGHTSPTTAQHVLDDLDGRIDLVLDAGSTACGVESTVVEVQSDRVIVYRPGAIGIEEIRAVAGTVTFYQPRDGSLHPTLATQDPSAGSGQAPVRMGHPENVPPESLPSPGVGIRHYAPRARLILVEAAREEDLRSEWVKAVREHSMAPARAGVMLPDGWPLPDGFSGFQYAWGDWRNDRELARRLFAGLRELDTNGAEVVLCPLPPDSGLGTALRDRLRKAAREE